MAGNFDYSGYFGIGGGQRQPQQSNNYSGTPRMTTGSSMYGPKPYKRAFYSKVNKEDSIQQCINAGYRPISTFLNPHNQWVTFGRYNSNTQNQNFRNRM